jgi:hypothetical protein
LQASVAAPYRSENGGGMEGKINELAAAGAPARRAAREKLGVTMDAHCDRRC